MKHLTNVPIFCIQRCSISIYSVRTNKCAGLDLNSRRWEGAASYVSAAIGLPSKTMIGAGLVSWLTG